MRVSVFGLGYVGCVTAACLARHGHHVVGTDINDQKVAMMGVGRSPILEPGLGEVLGDVVGSGQLRTTRSAGDAVQQSDVALLCVGTPGHPNGGLDLRALRRVVEEIGALLRARSTPYTIVVRSTVLPGTTDDVLLPLLRAAAGPRASDCIRVAVNPEFTREGSSVSDFSAPSFTLVGCADPETENVLRTLYAGVRAPFVRTSIRVAEMVKYAANAFHGLKICFANEVADLSTALGVPAQEVMRIFRMDGRLNISEAYLKPGFAFGGSCLPKDLRALVHAARTADVSVPVLAAILPSNESHIRQRVDEVLRTRKRRVGVVGLSFKLGTDDLRESPMVALVEALLGKGCHVRILDRNVSIGGLIGANRRYIEEEIPHVASLMCDDVASLLAHAEVLVIGNAGAEAAEVLAGAAPHQLVVDLTRGGHEH